VNDTEEILLRIITFSENNKFEKICDFVGAYLSAVTSLVKHRLI